MNFCTKLLKEKEPLYALVNNGGALPTHQVIKNNNLEEDNGWILVNSVPINDKINIFYF